ncbi:MAG: hypothetical protein ABI333_07150 [bacterium]
MTLRATLLLAVLVATTGCENLQRPEETTRTSPETAARAVESGACEQLCTRQASCLSTFRRLGDEGFFGPVGTESRSASTPPDECARGCRSAARDAVVGPLLAQVIRTCAKKGDCDAFYGCAVRLRLGTLAQHPWMKRIILARKTALQISADLRTGHAHDGVRKCLRAETFRGLRELKRPPARAVREELSRVCARALRVQLTAARNRLNGAVERIDPDDHGADCSAVRQKLPPWLAADDGVLLLVGQTQRLCEQIDGQRPLAFTMRDASRDATQVRLSLHSGKSSDALYYKCVHKGHAYDTLSTAGKPRAMKVASLLRTVCFEEFAVAFLRRHQRSGAALDASRCYHVRQVLSLLTKRARSQVVSANRSLVKWARGVCPQ